MSTDLPEREQPKLRDPTQHLNRRRIDEILDSQEHVLEQHAKAQDIQLEGYSRELAQQIVYQAVSRLARVTRSLFVRLDEGPEYWYGKEEWEPLGEIPHPGDGEPLVVESLAHYLNLEGPVTFAVTSESRDLVRGRQKETETVEVGVPMSVSLNAYDVINDFLRLEVGLDLDLDRGRPLSSYE